MKINCNKFLRVVAMLSNFTFSAAKIPGKIDFEKASVSFLLYKLLAKKNEAL